MRVEGELSKTTGMKYEILLMRYAPGNIEPKA